MSIKIFSDSIDVAVIGLTNSGKSTFITSMFDYNKFNSSLIEKLHDNDGGLTKVTTFYELTDCEKPTVVEVKFDLQSITRGIQENEIESMNNKLIGVDYESFKIGPVVGDDNGNFTNSLEVNLEKFANKVKADMDFAISIINNPKADKLVRYIKIQVPALPEILKIMKANSFNSVILRDTRGFLDVNIDQVQKKTPTLADSGLDGIQACILMNGQDSTMPNLGREIYGEFVKAIFEAVPTFIIERSGKLAGKLEDCVDDNININSGIYNNLVNNKKILSLNFNEMHKFLLGLGVIDDNGKSTNQLIEAHKREILLPEVSVLKGHKEIDYSSDEYHIYNICVEEVFKNLLSSLSEFRSLLNKIVYFFDDKDRLNAVKNSFINEFHEKLFPRIISGYYDYSMYPYQLVRPVTNGYSKDNLLGNLLNEKLLGDRGGITTKVGSHYIYGATGVYAATEWNAMNIMITGLNNYQNIIDVIKQYVGNSENKDILNAYILEIQQCFRYILQNSFTDIWAHFSGYPIIERYKVKSAIIEMRNQWKQLTDTNINHKEFMNRMLPKYNFSNLDYISFFQLWQVCYNTINRFFSYVSNESTLKNSN